MTYALLRASILLSAPAEGFVPIQASRPVSTRHAGVRTPHAIIRSGRNRWLKLELLPGSVPRNPDLLGWVAVGLEQSFDEFVGRRPR